MATLPNEADKGKFFTFPLPLLYPDERHEKTISRIIRFCVLNVGRSSFENLDEAVVDSKLSCADLPDDFDDAEDAHRQVILGCDRLGVTIGGSMRAILADAKVAEQIVKSAEWSNGNAPLVFIGAKILWECMKGEFPYRDFTVLCAVNSIIGQKTTPQLIRRSLILARAAGFKSPACYGKGCSSGYKARLQLTVDELRWTLTKLEEREFFARVQASPRRVYFSRGAREKLLADVTAMVATQHQNKVANRRAEEREAMRKARTEGAK